LTFLVHAFFENQTSNSPQTTEKQGLGYITTGLSTPIVQLLCQFTSRTNLSRVMNLQCVE